LCQLYASILTIPHNTPPPTDTYTLSLHDALPISRRIVSLLRDLRDQGRQASDHRLHRALALGELLQGHRAPRLRPMALQKFSQRDRKSTRLNSSHVAISYAVFCLKKKIKLTIVSH